MAEYLTNTEDMKIVADAIRAKGGTAAPLEFPQGMADAVAAIPSGGKMDEEIKKWATNRDWTFYLDGVTEITSPSFLKDLRTVYHVVAKDLIASKRYGAFFGCSELETVDMPNLETTLGSEEMFNRCGKLNNVVLPKIRDIGRWMFDQCWGLTVLVLPGPVVANLYDPKVFEKGPIDTGKGYVYVPKNLVEQYKVATNWASLANQIRAIEDYPDIVGGLLK